MLAIIDVPIILGILFFGAASGIAQIWFLWRALDRAGLTGALALISLIPFGVFVVLGILAFAEWPNLRVQAQATQLQQSPP
ncbi:MAG TPA: hypothetical protein VMV73_06245 [Candidatus Dormibacteraeota bacterium]|nr:hypothetical protein [Candidatus Dormibacteraeota bacterium]